MIGCTKPQPQSHCNWNDGKRKQLARWRVGYCHVNSSILWYNEFPFRRLQSFPKREISPCNSRQSRVVRSISSTWTAVWTGLVICMFLGRMSTAAALVDRWTLTSQKYLKGYVWCRHELPGHNQRCLWELLPHPCQFGSIDPKVTGSRLHTGNCQCRVNWVMCPMTSNMLTIPSITSTSSTSLKALQQLITHVRTVSYHKQSLAIAILCQQQQMPYLMQHTLAS